VARPISGEGGSGEVVVYTLSPSDRFRVGTISFTVVADAAGVNHSPEVLLLAQAGALIARIADWNDLADGMTVTYTYGVDLTPFCGVANDGGAVQNDLPDVELVADCSIVVRSVDPAGVVIPGDVISNVLLWVDDAARAAELELPAVVPPYTSQPFAAQVGAV